MKYAVILMFLLPLMSPLNAQSLATQSIGSAGFAGPAAGTNKLYWNVGEVIVGLGTNGSQLNQGFFQYFDLSTALHDPDYNHNLISAWPNTANDVILFGQTDPVDIQSSSEQFGIGMFSRHYFNSEEKFKIFVQPYIEYNSLNEDESQNSIVVQRERAHYIDIGIGA